MQKGNFSVQRGIFINLQYELTFPKNRPSRVVGTLDLKSFICKDRGMSPCVASNMVGTRANGMAVSSVKVDPALNE